MKGILLKFILVYVAVVIISAVIFPLIMFYQRPAVTAQFPNKIQEVLPSVVHIMCNRWQGSGVAISEDIIVTARHVIDGTNYTITLNNGCKVKGIQAITHKDYDIGFIKIDRVCIAKFDEHEPSWSAGRIFGMRHLAPIKPAKFGSINNCVLGQPIFAIGSTAGKINFNSISLGIVSGLNRGGSWKNGVGNDYGWSVLFQTDAEGMGGNSGCPVFTMDGIVRGIWVGSMPPAVHYCIPVDIFLVDIKMIQLMFGVDNYKIEEIRPFNAGMEW